MSRQMSREFSQRSETHSLEADRRPADVEMERVLKTSLLRKASDLSSGVLAYWKHDAPRDVVEPMTAGLPAGCAARSTETGQKPLP